MEGSNSGMSDEEYNAYIKSIDFFDYAYCISVHKSQGSEFEKVILFDERNYYQTDDDYNRWVYTGITRAKDKLIIVE